ncbi:response regulator, partial [Streptomyces sp. HSW2009]|uniref:response regulator n=1 Tax=Streptomyces sp. HSW2009 TaxID=3142890 RepID=UPI0032EDAE56
MPVPAPAPVPRQREASAAALPVPSGPLPEAGISLLVIENDPSGALTMPELTDADGKPVRVRSARNLTEAQRLLTDEAQCIVLDLALPRPTDDEGEAAGGPDADGDDALATLREVLRIAPGHAVLALTAEGDAERAAEAVRVGAQDYLFRDELDDRVLSRAVRYAVERKRADRARRLLTESRLRARENARLERGLLPTPLLDGSDLRFAACYRPGRRRAGRGGAFYATRLLYTTGAARETPSGDVGG